jgi:hypothetical protein
MVQKPRRIATMVARMRHMAAALQKYAISRPAQTALSHKRSHFGAAGRFGAPMRNVPPRAGMRGDDIDQRRRDQQQLGLERGIAHDMRRIGAEQQESHADREQKTEPR